MKAITEKQPWASLIIEPDVNNIGFGIKPIENRTWPCPKKYIGKRVLIHAGAKYDDRHTSMNKLFTSYQWKYMSENKGNKLLHHCLFYSFPIGAIIGSVEIVDCVINHPSIWAEKTLKKHRCPECDSLKISKGHCYDCGFNFIEKPIYNWILANPIKFKKPIPVKGRLSFWESQCEILECPQCGKYCLHDNYDVSVPNWGNPVHICEHCEYAILESEFEFLK
jgi:ribosomal protein L32